MARTASEGMRRHSHQEHESAGLVSKGSGLIMTQKLNNSVSDTDYRGNKAIPIPMAGGCELLNEGPDLAEDVERPEGQDPTVAAPQIHPPENVQNSRSEQLGHNVGLRDGVSGPKVSSSGSPTNPNHQGIRLDDKDSETTLCKNPCSDDKPEVDCLGLADFGVRANLFRKGHRRNLAAAKITPLGVEDVKRTEPVRDEPTGVIVQDIPALKSCTEIMPAQVMKALPPLPVGEHRRAGNGDSLHTYAAASFAPSDEDELYSNNRYKQLSERNGHSPAKLKLRIKPGFELGSLDSDPCTNAKGDNLDARDQCVSISPSQRKLKLKVSRCQPISGANNGQGTVLRSPALKHHNSMVDMGNWAPTDLFSDRCHFGNASIGITTKKSIERCSGDWEDRLKAQSPSPQPLPQWPPLRLWPRPEHPPDRAAASALRNRLRGQPSAGRAGA